MIELSLFREKVLRWLEDPVETENRKRIDEVNKLREEFVKVFPFREKPHLINDLTPDRIYQKGVKDIFLYWVEYKLKDLGS